MANEKSKLRQSDRALPIALLKAREKVMMRFRPMLARHGLTEQQWRVLRVLFEGGKAEAGQLAENACILAPSLTRILKALEKDGLIERHRDATDARRSLLAITEEGKQLVLKIAPESTAIYEKLEDEIGRERIADLLKLLAEINSD